MMTMTDDAILPILIKIQERLFGIEHRLEKIEVALVELRVELDGQFSLMTSKNKGAEALERLVAAQGKRITALENRP